ncbi:hypothetical protein [Myxococcus landrumensis]|nr:hypothetical protein [Myxococcus landrumus]
MRDVSDSSTQGWEASDCATSLDHPTDQPLRTKGKNRFAIS